MTKRTIEADYIFTQNEFLVTWFAIHQILPAEAHLLPHANLVQFCFDRTPEAERIEQTFWANQELQRFSDQHPKTHKLIKQVRWQQERNQGRAR